MRFTVWGAGAIGGVVGAYMAHGGEDVTFVDQDAAHVAAMNERGLFLDGVRGEFSVPVRALTPKEVSGPLDVVLLAVKCLHTEAAMRQIMPHLTPDSSVVSLQNGLNERLIAELIGPERTVGAFVNFGSDYLAPGHIRHGGEAPIYIGELDGAMTPRLEALTRALGHFGEIIPTDNIWGFLWSKLAYASILFATALIDEPIYDIVGPPEARRVLAELAREVIAVARAEGVTLMPFAEFDPAALDAATAGLEGYQRVMDSIATHYRGQVKVKTGIWRDLAVRKRKTEVDCQIGEVVQIGRERGVPTPLNAALVGLIHDLEDGRRQMGWETFNALAREAARA